MSVVVIPPHRRVWLVGFGNGDPRDPWHWARLFTRDGYRHVVALSEEGEGTLVVQTLSNRLELRWLKIPLGRLVRRMMAEGFWFLAYETEIMARMMWPGLMTCVEVVKAVVGVRSPFVLTVYQLYRWLRARGALPVLSTRASETTT